MLYPLICRLLEQKQTNLHRYLLDYSQQNCLQFIRAVDHLIPALRLDVAIRIMDEYEYIESIEEKEKADEICKEVAAYVWEVESLRCDYDMRKLYVLIAHTPKAQVFFRSLRYCDREKNKFKPYMKKEI